MPAPRTFTADEIEAAKSMRLNGMSWREVGRRFGCHEDTIRCALDDEYRQCRHDAIAARRRDSRRAAKALAERTARRADAAYRPLASLGMEGHPGRIAKAAANSGGGKVRAFFAQ